jgi:hypothetical protein
MEADAVGARGEGTMSTMRDGGVVLVLLLLAMTVRVDQPTGQSLVPEARAAQPAVVTPVDVPAVQTERPEGPHRTTTEVRHEVRVVRLGVGAVAGLAELPKLPSVVLATPDGEMRFVFVGSPAPEAAPAASPATVG